MYRGELLSPSKARFWRPQLTQIHPKVLIVEDDLMIADAVEEFLAKCGYEVCGVARDVPAAISLGRQHKPDLAVIDLRLADGGLGTAVAADLITRGRIGILYATANITSFMLNAVDGDAYLVKPYSPADLLRSLEIVTDIVATGRASPPFPRGFKMLPLPVSHAAAPACPGKSAELIWI
jgi:CheY-like chemotaxis protein